jgi:hypothetical protein
MHRKKKNGVILKLDFEKAYDKVQWTFLQQVLRMKSFSSKWCLWIEQVVTKGSVGIKVNNDIGHNLDPLLPILFNLIVDMLATLISRSKDLGHVFGFVPHLVGDDLSIL